MLNGKVKEVIYKDMTKNFVETWKGQRRRKSSTSPSKTKLRIKWTHIIYQNNKNSKNFKKDSVKIQKN